MSLRIDAGFNKLLPMQHPYIHNLLKHRAQFGGANRILIDLSVRKGDIFTPVFFQALKQATDAVFFLPGIDRARVHSLFTPNTRFTEVVEDGISGGNVIPQDFQDDKAGLAEVRNNILKAGIVGRLVANDFSGAMITAQLLEIDPETGKRVDYLRVSRLLEQRIRDRFETTAIDTNIKLDVHIIGFAKAIGDISDGARRVILFFAITILLTGILLRLFTRTWRATLAILGCSLVAVVWQLGLLPLLGYGMDPMSVLVPFLIFAISVSHGVQMVHAIRHHLVDNDTFLAVRKAFIRLVIPGGVALLSDTIGFVTILLIHIAVIQEMAITASLGVAVIILTNFLLLPLILCGCQLRAVPKGVGGLMSAVWRGLSSLALPSRGSWVALLALMLLGLGLWQAAGIKIGDLQRGVPELRADSRYNLDTMAITRRYSIGVDVLSIYAETVKDACIDYAVMDTIERFRWRMANVKGVHSALALSSVVKVINAGWNEGDPHWRVLSRNPQVLVQSVALVETSSGLLNSDCTVMPVYLFTLDHKAETIERIIKAAKTNARQLATDKVKFTLAGNNVGVMAASNEAVQAAQIPILAYVFTAVALLCWLTFRSFRAMLCVLLPLALVSVFAYAVMSWLEIGLKVSTLPVVALGIGVGVDYGIYIFAGFQHFLYQGRSLPDAYLLALEQSGSSVVFTAVTLAIGVATWVFSPLKFQADMGILLTFLFLVNMLATVVLLPALASLLFRTQPKAATT
ncbi:MAG TPA: RND family transporter [Gammaproteobacteria bacterium]|nr:RND family transporter [Gammaproteobacteria bacterium]